MVRLNKIYTRGGDTGDTSLGNGKRVPKESLRVDAYGTVDEANATIGLARMEILRAKEKITEIDSVLARIQNDLFDLGADLCTPENSSQSKQTLRIIESQITVLEREIDRFNAELEAINSFILPGGSPVASHLHLARTITRRAERLVVALARTELVNPCLIKYLNRLSDLLFVLSRTSNDNGHNDVLWVPGGTR